MSISIKMPGGGIQEIDGDDLQWMRNAFTSEWKGTVMLRLRDVVIYSIESLQILADKFETDGDPLVNFTSPDGQTTLLVNPTNVKRVDESNPVFHHEDARALLKFDRKTALAVRETVDEVKRRLRGVGEVARVRIMPSG